MTKTGHLMALGGGGLKVAFQAGVMERFEERSDIDFTRYTAASGACLNLIQYCYGRTWADIADRWRHFDPTSTTLDARTLHTELAESWFRPDAILDYLLEGLDIEECDPTHEGVFPSYNFSTHETVLWTAGNMTRQRLAATVALPGVFPAVHIDSDVHVDHVYASDLLLGGETRCRCDASGADCRLEADVWSLWVLPLKGKWRNGRLNHYFQILEIAAVSQYKKDRDHLASRNGHKYRALEYDVPMNYILNFSKDRFREVVDLGYRQADVWLRAPAPVIP